MTRLTNLTAAEKKFLDDAVAAYQKYLGVQPAAGNAQQVRDEITRLQYFQERQPEKPQAGWIFLAKKTSGDRVGDTVYFDKSTIRTENGITSVMMLWDYAQPPAGGWDYWSIKEMHEINCQARQGRRVSVTSYDEHMGKGKVLHQFMKQEPSYAGNAPGSLSKILIDEVCR